MREYNVAVVGASGAVGEEILGLLGSCGFAIKNLKLLSSSRSAGEGVVALGRKWVIEEISQKSFEDIDIAFFSAGSNVSSEYAPIAAKLGALVIDNTSYFRMREDIPLVVPEVNASDIQHFSKTNIIANPNCSTIQMVQILNPLHSQWKIRRVDVSTYQAVSGAGRKGMKELVDQMQKFFAFRLTESESEVFPHRIALNVIPHIDSFLENGYTKEEVKMMKETNKIMHSDIAVSATCVRVPVLRSHSESISIHFDEEVEAGEARELLRGAKNIVVMDEVFLNKYPMPIIATDTDETYVGRIRSDLYDRRILHLWCVADQLRVGAASNAVKIAKEWTRQTQI